jgi:hypothetical protein
MSQAKYVPTEKFIPRRFRFNSSTEGEFVDLPVELCTQYRHTLFQAMHGNVDDVILVDCSKLTSDDKGREINPDLVTQALTDNLPDGYRLDGATGSRKKGQVFATSRKGKTYSELYLSGSKRVSHYSMLWSENRAIVNLSNVRVVVLDDADYELQVEIGVGDCHGLIGHSLHQAIVEASDPFLKSPIDPRGMLQFRLALKSKWCAKGTTLPLGGELEFKGEPVDLILPASSFKGSCPKLGKVHEYKSLYFGIYKVSRTTRYSTSHTVTGWFQSEDSKKFLLDAAREEMETLIEKRKDVRKLAVHYLDRTVGTVDGELSDDPEERIEQEKKLAFCSYARILSKDTYNQLALHPKTKQWANQITANLVKDIALGSFIRAKGSMLAPLPFLKGDTVISHDLPTGQYVYWRYPIRAYNDIFKVYVINTRDLRCRLERYLGYFTDLNLLDSIYFQSLVNSDLTGTAWVSPSVARKSAADYDGDYGCFIPCSEIRPLADEIDTWQELPEPVKPPKNPINGSLESIAAKSMSNKVGLISYIITCCRILGWKFHYPKLAEALQTEVDGLKSENPVDWAYVNDVLKRTGSAFKEAEKKGIQAWVRCYKHPDLYTQRPLVSHYDDIISKLCNLTSEMWEKGIDPDDISPFQCRSTHDFRCLFDPLVPYESIPKEWFHRAGDWVYEYKKMLGGVLRIKKERMTVTEIEEFRQGLKEIGDHFKRKADSITNPASKLKFAAAMHRVLHDRPKPGEDNSERICSLVFQIFPDEYIRALSTPPNYQFRLWRNCEKAPSDLGDKVFNNEIVPVKITNTRFTVNGQEVDALYMVELHTGKKVARVVTDNMAGYVSLPLPETRLVVKVNSVFSPSKKTYTYHEARVVPEEALEF